MTSGSERSGGAEFFCGFDLNYTADIVGSAASSGSLLNWSSGLVGSEGEANEVDGGAADDAMAVVNKYFGGSYDIDEEKVRDFGVREVSMGFGGKSNNVGDGLGAGVSKSGVVVGGSVVCGEGVVGADGGFRIRELSVPVKKGRGRPPKGAAVKSLSSIGGIDQMVVVSGGITVEIGPSVVGHRIGAAEVVTQLEGETPKRRARGRPPRSFPSKTVDNVGRFANNVLVYGDETNGIGVVDGAGFVNEESFKICGRGMPRKSGATLKWGSNGSFGDELVVIGDVGDVYGSDFVGSGVSAPGGIAQVLEEQTSNKKRRGRPPKSAIVKTQENNGGFDKKVVVKVDKSDVFGSLFACSEADVVDDLVQFKAEDSCKKRGRGRPPKSATAKADCNGKLDKVVATKEYTGDMFGSSSNGFRAMDGIIGQVNEEETCKKRGRGRRPKSATVLTQDGSGKFDNEVVVIETDEGGFGVNCNGADTATMKSQDNSGRFDAEMLLKKDAADDIDLVYPANCVSAADGFAQFVEAGSPKKRGRGRPPKSASNINQDKSLQVIVQRKSMKRKRGRPVYYASEDYEDDSTDDEEWAFEDHEYNSTDDDGWEMSERKSRRSQLVGVEYTLERDPGGEVQGRSQARRGRPRRIVMDSAKVASYAFPFQDEKKVDFAAYDLVWGKAKRHFWWPGQIFDASLSSMMALGTQKDGQFLVAYFGDNTLAWCDESELMPFQSNFPQMEKHSYLDSFQTAVGAALEDVSKRVQFSMICSCYRGGAYASRLNQKLRNSGITEGACGSAANRSWIIETFDPNKLIEYLKTLAETSNVWVNRLDLAIVNAQLDAFHHSKGYLDRPVLMGEEPVVKGKGLPPRKQKIHKGFPDPSDPNTSCLASGKGWSKGGSGSSLPGKSRHDIDGRRKKISELMHDEGSRQYEASMRCSPRGIATSDRSGQNRKVAPSDPINSVETKKERIDSLGDFPSNLPFAAHKKLPSAGEHICHIAGQITGSPSVPACNGETLKKCSIKRNCGSDFFNGHLSVPLANAEYSALNKLLLDLCLVATDPLNEQASMCKIVDYFSTFRNWLATSSKDEKPDIVGNKILKETFEAKSATITMGSVQDSYWNDIIISDPEEEPTSEDQKGKGVSRTRINSGKRETVQKAALASDQSSRMLSSPEKPLINLHDPEECMPTQLVLAFADSYVLPSVADLVKIFGRYGHLREAETQIMQSLKIGKVVFKKRADAEVVEAALRGKGEYSLFGQACIGYKLENLGRNGPTLSNTGVVQHLVPKRPLIELQDVEERIPTEIVLAFGDSYALPSVVDLVNIFGQYGPLRESETQVNESLKVGRVVFKRHADAEEAELALTSAGKHSFFQQASVLGYKLRNLETTLQSFSLLQ